MKSPIRVLLVDDDEEDFLLTSSLLADVPDTDYEVTWVATAAHAAEWLEDEPEHDVCLLDHHLGARTGVDVLRDLAGRSTIPCILLTGTADAATDRAAMEAGASDYLVKGQFDEQLLERTIRYAIENASTLRSLRESEERFRSVVEAATDGIALLGDDGLVLTCNAAMEAVFGVEAGALHGTRFADRLGDDGGDVLALMESPTTYSAVQVTATEAEGTRPDGSTFPLEISMSAWANADGRRYWSAIVRDVTDRKALADRLVHQAHHDPLTGLANRVLLRDRVELAIERIGRTERSVALLFLDLDDFKRVNDAFGHEVGDEVLTSVATRLLGCVRRGEIVARLGGDEFAVFLEDLGDAQAVLRLADRIVHAMGPTFQVRGRPTVLTFSIGIAITDDPDADPDELLRHADIAMYAAKARGKNCYEVFEDSMHGRLVERVRLENDLRAALDSDRISLVYQPVVRLGTLEIVGFEALARWDDARRGPVSPAVFVSVAEDSGLINQLGRMTMTKAVRQAAAWQQRFTDRPPITMSVNLSSCQLADPDLVGFLADLLEDTPLAPGTLALEITETVLVGDVDHAISTLHKLREVGVGLALDDFGTGYSSLSYLHLLPLDVVKVDQSFIARIGERNGTPLVEAIASIGESLGFDLVAEGIEDGAQRRLLTKAGYRYGQGYLFSKPLSVEEATELLATSAAQPAPSDRDDSA